jgi:hypothetical protein
MIRALKDPYLSSYTEEYGDPGDPEMLPVLMSYSPLHHIKAGSAYPATFVLSGKNDVRCPALERTEAGRPFQNAPDRRRQFYFGLPAEDMVQGLSLQEASSGERIFLVYYAAPGKMRVAQTE